MSENKTNETGLEKDSDELSESEVLSKLKEKLGKDFSDVGAEDIEFIQKFIAKKDVDTDKIEYIAESVPGFVEKQMKAIEMIKDTTDRLQESQDKALEEARTLDGLYNTLDTLAENAESDEARIEIAKITREVGEISIKISENIKEINKDNNKAWTMVSFGIGLGASLIGGYLVRDLPIDDYLSG